MLYKIKNDLQEVSYDSYESTCLYIGFLNEQELKGTSEFCFHNSDEVLQQLHSYHKQQSKISKIDAYPEYYIGEIHLLNKERTAYEGTITFLIKKNLLLVISNNAQLLSYYHDQFLTRDVQITSLERLVFLFLDDIIQNDNLMLDALQQTLSDIDERVFKNMPMKFNQQIEIPRRQIILLDHTYDHLLEIGEELVDNELDFFDANTRYLKILKDRFNRLHNATNMLQEFMITIRETHQSNINNDLNNIMKLLTVLTAIFQPLTLIVGWYGMNFTNMPELTWQYGYMFVISLSIGSICLCYWIFRKKKLL